MVEWHRLELFTLEFQRNTDNIINGLYWQWDADETPSFFLRWTPQVHRVLMDVNVKFTLRPILV